MTKKQKLIAVATSVVIALSGIAFLLYKNVVYNGANGMYSYSQGNCKTVNAYYMLALPYFGEDHLERIITDYIEDTDLFNKIAKEESALTYTRICIRFNKPSFRWPIGIKLDPDDAEELSTVSRGNEIATCITVIQTGERATSYYYYYGDYSTDSKEYKIENSKFK